MVRENTVHDTYVLSLANRIEASRFSYKGSILGVFFDGEFNSASSVIPVKLSVKKDSLITPYRKTLRHGEHVRATVEHLFFLYRKNGNSGVQTCGWEKVHER